MDVIILGHVIRHFSDPVGSFEKLKSLLSENGYLYFDYGEDLFDTHKDIRNIDRLHWFSHQKRFYYSQQTITYLMKKVGFEIIDNRKINLGLSTLSPAFLCRKMKPEFLQRDVTSSGTHFLEVKSYLDKYMPKLTIKEKIKYKLKQFGHDNLCTINQ